MIKVEVTQDDIDNARTALNQYNPTAAHRCFACPVALGAARAYGVLIKVGPRHMGYRDEYRHTIGQIALPGVAIAFIKDFDHCQTVSPFSFEAADIDNS